MTSDATVEALRREISEVRAELRALMAQRAEAAEGGGDPPTPTPVVGGAGITAARVGDNWVVSALGGGGGHRMPLDLVAEDGKIYARNLGFNVRVCQWSAQPEILDPGLAMWEVGRYGWNVYLVVWRVDGDGAESSLWRWDLVNDPGDGPTGSFVVHVGHVSGLGEVTQKFHGNVLIVAPKSAELTMVADVGYDAGRHALIGYKRKWVQIAGKIAPVGQPDMYVDSYTDPDTGAVSAEIKPLLDENDNPVMTEGPVPFIVAQFVRESY